MPFFLSLRENWTHSGRRVTKLLADVLPKQVLNEMALLGDRIYASRLHQLGMINVLTKEGFSKNEAIGFSSKFDNSPSNSIKRIKFLNHQAYKNNFNDQMALEAKLMAESQGDVESIEGIDAFLEKRKADFKKINR